MIIDLPPVRISSFQLNPYLGIDNYGSQPIGFSFNTGLHFFNVCILIL